MLTGGSIISIKESRHSKTFILGEYAPLVEKKELAAKKDADKKRRDADQKRKERLAFVSLSLSNMLPERKKGRLDTFKLHIFHVKHIGMFAQNSHY